MVLRRKNFEILAVAAAAAAAFWMNPHYSHAFIVSPTTSPSSSTLSGRQQQQKYKNFISIENCLQKSNRYHHHHKISLPNSLLRSSGDRLTTTNAKTTATSLNLWSSGEDIEGTNRYKACVPYLLPLLDGEQFGHYIYERIPPLGFLDSLFIGPLYEIFSQFPFSGLIVFVALTLGTRGNTDMDRSVRFNAQQAALIDIALVFPELIGSAFEGEDIPRYLVEPCMNFVWYAYMTAVLYSIISNLRGKKPDQIPWISGYAELMVGPF